MDYFIKNVTEYDYNYFKNKLSVLRYFCLQKIETLGKNVIFN